MATFVLDPQTDVYPWAAGHTWQSWRNRYRKKQDYFDPIIDGFVATRQRNGDGKVSPLFLFKGDDTLLSAFYAPFGFGDFSLIGSW